MKDKIRVKRVGKDKDKGLGLEEIMMMKDKDKGLG